MKVMTLPQAIKEIRIQDPDSALSETMLQTLIEEKRIPYGNRGNRTVIKLDMVISAINEMLGFAGATSLPQIRTIRKGAVEINNSSEYFLIGETHIRKCVADGKVPTITIGNRKYIALQSFKEPYCKCLIYGESPEREKRHEMKDDMLQQMNASISSRSGVPRVVRVKAKK